MRVESLVICYKQLGDTLLTEPALDALAQKTGEPVGLIVRRDFSDLVALMGPGVRSLRPSPALRAGRIFCADAGSRSAVRALVCRGPREVIVEREEQIRAIHRIGGFKLVRIPMEREYRARWLWRGVTADMDHPPAFRPPRLNLPPENWRGGFSLPDPNDGSEGPAVLHVGSAWRRKCWPVERWAELIRHWPQSSGPLILSAGPSDWEQELTRAIVAQLPRDKVVPTGCLDFRAFCWMLSKASRVVAVDGAAAHLARAFQVPVLTLFGETDPAEWHWDSPHSRMLRAPDERMELLETTEVLQALQEIPVNRT